MASARLYGRKTAYTPNSKADTLSQKYAERRRRMKAEVEREIEKQSKRRLLDIKKGNGGEPCV